MGEAMRRPVFGLMPAACSVAFRSSCNPRTRAGLASLPLVLGRAATAVPDLLVDNCRADLGATSVCNVSGTRRVGDAAFREVRRPRTVALSRAPWATFEIFHVRATVASTPAIWSIVCVESPPAAAACWLTLPTYVYTILKGRRPASVPSV
eukprot:5235089-Prymnesium_polylepis.1